MFKGGFTDANNQKVSVGDLVEYRFGARRGILKEALQDGDAFVLFINDTNQTEQVKWINLCKVPDEFVNTGPITKLLATDNVIRSIRRNIDKIGKSEMIRILSDEIKYLAN